MHEIKIEAKRLYAGYGSHTVLKNVSVKIYKEEITVIIGQNGSGKSTLLRAIAGIIPLINGYVKVNGFMNNIKTHLLVKHGISYFHQGGLIIPSLTVGEHLELSMKLCGKNYSNFDFVFEEFDALRELSNRRAGNLSGGERQMLSLGILLVQGNDTWILDEPCSGLSPEMVDYTVNFLLKKNKTESVTMLIVEHNMEAAFRLADSIVVAKDETLSEKYTRNEFLEENFLTKTFYN